MYRRDDLTGSTSSAAFPVVRRLTLAPEFNPSKLVRKLRANVSCASGLSAAVQTVFFALINQDTNYSIPQEIPVAYTLATGTLVLPPQSNGVVDLIREEEYLTQRYNEIDLIMFIYPYPLGDVNLHISVVLEYDQADRL